MRMADIPLTGFNPQTFHYVLTFTKTRCIDQSHWPSSGVYQAFNCVSSGAWNFGDNCSFLAKESVEKRGFTHIGLSGDYHYRSILHYPADRNSRQKKFERLEQNIDRFNNSAL